MKYLIQAYKDALRGKSRLIAQRVDGGYRMTDSLVMMYVPAALANRMPLLYALPSDGAHWLEFGKWQPSTSSLTSQSWDAWQQMETTPLRVTAMLREAGVDLRVFHDPDGNEVLAPRAQMDMLDTKWSELKDRYTFSLDERGAIHCQTKAGNMQGYIMRTIPSAKAVWK